MCCHEKAQVILVAYHCCQSEIDRQKFEKKEGVGIVSNPKGKKSNLPAQTPGWHHLTKGLRLTPPVTGRQYAAWRRYLYSPNTSLPSNHEGTLDKAEAHSTKSLTGVLQKCQGCERRERNEKRSHPRKACGNLKTKRDMASLEHKRDVSGTAGEVLIKPMVW